MKKQIMLKLQALGFNPRYQGKSKTIFTNGYPDGITLANIEQSGYKIVIDNN